MSGDEDEGENGGTCAIEESLDRFRGTSRPKKGNWPTTSNAGLKQSPGKRLLRRYTPNLRFGIAYVTKMGGLRKSLKFSNFYRLMHC